MKKRGDKSQTKEKTSAKQTHVWGFSLHECRTGNKLAVFSCISDLGLWCQPFSIEETILSSSSCTVILSLVADGEFNHRLLLGYYYSIPKDSGVLTSLSHWLTPVTINTIIKIKYLVIKMCTCTHMYRYVHILIAFFFFKYGKG